MHLFYINFLLSLRNLEAARYEDLTFPAYVGCLFKASQFFSVAEVEVKLLPATLAVDTFFRHSTHRTALDAH